MIRRDTLWKGIIEDLVEDFIRFFFADFTKQINFSRSFVFLDKELEQLAPEAVAPGRHADKLFKAWMQHGAEQWFLVHVEVQGYADADFARRMFEYAYRILDRYQQPLAALAIYTGTDRRYHFAEYRAEFFGTEFIYRFQTFILMDHLPEALRRSGNLFGLALEVARRELDLNRQSDEQRLVGKVELVRHLFQQGVAKDKIRYLMNFIGQYIQFEKREYYHKFEEQIQPITKSRQAMGIEEAIIQEVKELGFQQGFQEGIEKGMEKGIEKGMEKGMEKGIEKGMEKGMEKGIEKGMEKGMEKVREKIVMRAWKKGMTLPDIAELTELPLERVEAIIREQDTGKGG